MLTMDMMILSIINYTLPIVHYFEVSKLLRLLRR